MASDYKKITEENERQLGLDTASRKTQIYLYSDPTHFIYELLQNADDYGATEVHFELTEDSLTIEHNGEPFTEENVKAITYFGKSTSKDDLVKTGRFGIGFKSVFAFTATPTVISGNEHFQIYGLYRVREVPYASNFSKERTRIILPFNHESEQPDFIEEVVTGSKAYEMIHRRLQTLNMRTLLFTKNILEIQWRSKSEKGEYLREDKQERGARVTTITDGDKDEKYMVFSRPIVWEGEDHKAVEVALAVSTEQKKERIVPVDDFLYVLFPTAQETRLKFIINGPFRTNPSRETVSEEDALNQHIIDESAYLMKEVLIGLRDSQLLDTDFFSILPNSSDELRPFFQTIYKELKTIFQNESLIPTTEKSYEVADNVYKGPKKIREVIGTEELRFLSGRDEVYWSKGVTPGIRADIFLVDIGVKDWSWYQISNLVKQKYKSYMYSETEKEINRKWIESRLDEWLQKFYMLLGECIRKDECSSGYPSLSESLIVRVKKGNKVEHISGNKAKFPKKGYSGVPQVKKEILKGKDEKEKEAIKESLRLLGVTEIGEEEAIHALLESYYNVEYVAVSDEEHLEHMSRFVAWWQKERNTKKFKQYKIFKCEDGVFRQAEECCVDMPYEDTSLYKLFQNSLVEIEKQKFCLSVQYNKIVSFKEFSKKVGVMYGLEIRKYKATEMQPEVFQKYGRLTETTVDRDFFINGLDCPDFSTWHNKSSKQFIGDLSCKKNYLVSLVVWKTMCRADEEVLSAYYLPNQANRHFEKFDSSYLVKQLSASKWVVGKDGAFYKPADLNKEMLHPEFVYNNSNGWLDAVGFGENIRRQNEVYQQKEAQVKEFGFESLDELEKLKKLDDVLKKIDKTPDDFIKELESLQNKAEFPEKEIANPKRREAKLLERFSEVEEKKYEERTRQVRISAGSINKESYLRRLYTNEDDKMLCQICQHEMPFKKRSGEYFFEAVEALNKDYFSKEHEAQYLALCPVCAAKYKEFVKRDEENMEEFWDKLYHSESKTIPLQLGDEEAEVRFVGTHFHDMKVILGT
jgi:hypothetical protein